MPRESFLQRFCSYANSGTTTGRISSTTPALTSWPRHKWPQVLFDEVAFTPEETAWQALVQKGYTRLFFGHHDMLKRAQEGEMLAQTLKVWYDIELTALRLMA